MGETKYELPVVAEVCANCESEIELRWDVKTMGYKAYCPVCGKTLMLCDACMHSGEDGAYTGYCDWERKTQSCFRLRDVSLENER